VAAAGTRSAVPASRSDQSGVWLDRKRSWASELARMDVYDINAKLPEESTPETQKVMLQNCWPTASNW